MSSFYSTYTTDLQTAGKMVPAVHNGAKVKVFPFKYTFLTGGGSAPKVFLSKIPPYHYILNLFIQCEALSISGAVACTITVTDGTNTFISAFDADAANNSQVMPVASFFTYYTTATWIYAQLATSKTPITGKAIWGYFLTADIS